jgi:sugar phosphate isomerase/epimerase
MDISICSFSFHRLLAAGKQDIFQYIKDCKELGCTLLDPWNAHLAPLQEGDKVLHAGHNPHDAQLSTADEDYIQQVKAAADEAGMPFGCIAVDGAHIYDADPEVRQANRARAYRWIEIAQTLNARQIRVDSGGPAELTVEIMEVIVDGYKDIISRAGNVEILIENHWGPSPIPDNVNKILDAVPGLGLLFDSFNWAEGKQQEGWDKCAHRARATHFKTFVFDENGNDTTQNIPQVIKQLKDAGYSGSWGVESVPKNGDEIEGARKTIELIKREVNA